MEQISQIVKQRLALGTAEAHPDANLLSAFSEKALGGRDYENILTHLSACGDCREIVALAMPEVEAAQVVLAPAVNRGWLRMPLFRLGLSIACVAIVGTAVTLHYRPSQDWRTGSQTARVVVPATEAANAQAAMPQAPVSRQVQAGKQVASESRNALVALAAPRVASRSMKQAPTNLAMIMIPGRAKAATPAAAANQAMADSGARLAPASLLDSTTPPLWTLGADGKVQRSLDSGKNWETISVADNETFLAITAQGQSVWLGGIDGVLYHSTDAGQHWAQVKPAADGDALNDDIIGLEFADAQHGRLTTPTATWSTEDAGKSWQKFQMSAISY